MMKVELRRCDDDAELVVERVLFHHWVNEPASDGGERREGTVSDHATTPIPPPPPPSPLPPTGYSASLKGSISAFPLADAAALTFAMVQGRQITRANVVVHLEGTREGEEGGGAGLFLTLCRAPPPGRCVRGCVEDPQLREPFSLCAVWRGCRLAPAARRQTVCGLSRRSRVRGGRRGKGMFVVPHPPPLPANGTMLRPPTSGPRPRRRPRSCTTCVSLFGAAVA